MIIIINFSLSTTFASSHKYLYVVFPFSSTSKYLLISLMISFLVKSLIKIVLFNFYAFWGFVVLLLLLISSFVPLWLEKITCMPSIFKNLLRIVLWPGIQDIWRMSYVNLRRVCVFPLLGTVFLYMLSLVHLWCFQIWWGFFFSYLFLHGWSIHYWKWGVENFNCYCRTIYFLFQLCQFLLQIFWRSVVRCINIYNCYRFLLY